MFDFNIDYQTITDAQARWDQAIENAHVALHNAIELVEDAERDEVEPDADEIRWLAGQFERAMMCMSDIAERLGNAVDDKPSSWWDSHEGETSYDVIEFDYVIDPDFDDIDAMCDLDYALEDIASYEFPENVVVKLD